MKIFLFLIFIFNFSFSSDKLVYSKSILKNNQIYVYFFNKSLFDVTLDIKYLEKNITPIYTNDIDTLPSNSNVLLRKYSLNNNSYNLKVNYSWSLGNKYSKHNDNYIYHLPFKKTKNIRISQGHNTKFTHNGKSLYALDFDVEIGTPIYAIREGLVVDVVEKHYSGGPSKKYSDNNNFITIKYSDGTYTKYAHLKNMGSLVEVGDYVLQGEHIGFSGNSGYSSGPHLHIVTFKGKNTGERESLKMNFKTLKYNNKKDFKTGELVSPIF